MKASSNHDITDRTVDDHTCPSVRDRRGQPARVEVRGDRSLATHFHELVHDLAADLTPRTWYGMPAYATPGKSGSAPRR